MFLRLPPAPGIGVDSGSLYSDQKLTIPVHKNMAVIAM